MKKVIILVLFVFHLHGMNEGEDIIPIQFLKDKSNNERLVITPDWVIHENVLKESINIRNNIVSLKVPNIFLINDIYGGYGFSPKKYNLLRQAIDNITFFKEGHYQYFGKTIIALKLVKKSELAAINEMIDTFFTIEKK